MFTGHNYVITCLVEKMQNNNIQRRRRALILLKVSSYITKDKDLIGGDLDFIPTNIHRKKNLIKDPITYENVQQSE